MRSVVLTDAAPEEPRRKSRDEAVPVEPEPRPRRLSQPDDTPAARQRNKRLFGVLQHTLADCAKETAAPSKAASKLQEIDQRLHQERERAEEERKRLVEARRSARGELKQMVSEKARLELVPAAPQATSNSKRNKLLFLF